MSAPPNLTFRTATIADLTAVQHTAAICFRVAHQQLDVPLDDINDYISKAYHADVLEKELTNTSCHWYVVVDENRVEEQQQQPQQQQQPNYVVAYVKLTWGDQQTFPDYVDNPKALQLQRLYVLPEYQSLKLGSLLQQYAVDFGMRAPQQFTTMWLTTHYRNDGAVRFYERHGYMKVGECYFKVKNTTNLNFVMERPFARAAL